MCDPPSKVAKPAPGKEPEEPCGQSLGASLVEAQGDGKPADDGCVAREPFSLEKGVLLATGVVVARPNHSLTPQSDAVEVTAPALVRVIADMIEARLREEVASTYPSVDDADTRGRQ